MVSPYDPRYQAFLKRLREAREDAGVTQERVAEHLDLVQPLVSRIEAGERKIDPIEFEELCKLYEKPATFFLPDLPV